MINQRYDMRKFGLIGYPLGHSFSKKYFTEKFRAENLSCCAYENFPLRDLSGFREFVASEQDLCGLNVTIPYKTEILQYIDKIDPEANEVGAVNVIKIHRNDQHIRLDGFNSDITGIADTILPYIDDSARNAVVLGTGGSSRAVCHVLRKLGLKIYIVSRAKKPGTIGYSDVTPEILGSAKLIINTTPLGMFPDTESKPDIDYKCLGPSHILFDLVYNPELTAFLQMGIQQGCLVLGGIRMLHSQAERAWEIWNNDSF